MPQHPHQPGGAHSSTGAASRGTTGFDPGCAKTRAFNLVVESSSQFGQSENQKCWRWLSEESNRENGSTLSWLAQVFTRPGPSAVASFGSQRRRPMPQKGRCRRRGRDGVTPHRTIIVRAAPQSLRRHRRGVCLAAHCTSEPRCAGEVTPLFGSADLTAFPAPAGTDHPRSCLRRNRVGTRQSL